VEPIEGTRHGDGIGRLIVQTTQSGGAVRLELRGEIDLASRTALQRELERAQKRVSTELVLDLERVTFMDSTGVSALVHALYHAQENGYVLRLVRLPAQARRVLEMSGVLARFNVTD
jgi:stage II sporulation protein AA (anti-sigma F factor antagonist)